MNTERPKPHVAEGRPLSRLTPHVSRLNAWGGSLFFHLVVLLLLMGWFQFQPVYRLAPGERNAVGGIVLAKATETGTSYVDGDGNEFGAANSSSGPPSLDDLLADGLSDVVLADSLPNPAIGPAPQTPGVARAASGLGGIGRGGFGTDLGGGKVRVSFFGTEGDGRKFVFVFDRSTSMNDYGGRPLRAARNELLQCLEPLTDFQQFNIIFYNDNFSVWRQRELPFATESNKANAVNFVRGITAMGGTQHYDPLIAALRLRPDVIFFLTDGEEKDALNGGQLANIRRLNPGIQINAVQFGVGATPPDRSFLQTLTAQNQGQYQYINIAELR